MLRTAPGRKATLLTARVAWFVLAFNALVIVWLWWNGGNVTHLRSTGDVLTSIGRITGLLSAYLALIQVLLLARLPPLERAAGFDRLTVWHRLNGKLCLYFLLAHVVFTTLGYAASDRLSIPSEASALLTNYPGMVAATVGTGVLIAVVISSLVIVRRRLPYEAWYLVHLSAYAAIALGWVHQIPTGNEFAVNRPAAGYWTSLYAVTLALLVVYRILQPLQRGLWHRMYVADVRQEAPGVVSVRITGRDLDRLQARAGQFFLWRFLSAGRWWQAHPFSLSRAPDGRSFRITVKALGDFTGRLGELSPGTAVLAEGPFGAFTDEVRRHDRVVYIAGGIGITPIRALLEVVQADAVLVYRALTDSDLIFRDEIDILANANGIRVYYVVGDHHSPGGEYLMSAEHLLEMVPDLTEREVYLCGPPGMMNAAQRSLRRAQVPLEHIHTEVFAL